LISFITKSTSYKASLEQSEVVEELKHSKQLAEKEAERLRIMCEELKVVYCQKTLEFLVKIHF